MSFKNAEIRKEANVYHDGKVTSRTMITASGEMKSLGVMLPGLYRFSTEAPEIMELNQGVCRVKLAGEDHWTDFSGGESFKVPGNWHFEIEVTELLDYICHFG